MTNRKRKSKEEEDSAKASPSTKATTAKATTTTSSPKKVKKVDDSSVVDDVSSSSSSIVDRLRAPNPLEALKLFASSLENDYDLVSQFVSLGGRSEDLLRILEEKGEAEDEKVKAPEVSVVFNAVETLFLYVAQQAGDQKCRSLTSDVVRKILQDHRSHIMRLLSPTNTAYQARSVLRMLTAMVACGEQQFARDILLGIDFEDKCFEGLVKRRSRDSAVDVRTSFVHLLVAFLIHGSTLVVKEFLEKKTKFTQIFPGLVQDSATTVEFLLMAMTEKVAENAGVSKTSKMKLFSAYNLKPLLGLFQWKGPTRTDEDEEEEQYTEEKERVVVAAKRFLTRIMTSTKLGIIFHDPTCGHSGQNQNHLLLSLLQAMSEPWNKPHLAELVTSALAVCPDQVRPYLVSLEPFWTPRSTDQWLHLADFVRDIMKSLKLDEIVASLDPGQPKIVVSVLVNLCLPEKMMREMVLLALESLEGPSVRRKGIEVLHVLLENVSKGFRKARDQQARKTASSRILERLPGPDLLQEFWKFEVKAASDEASSSSNSRHLSHFVEVLETLMKYYPNKYSSAHFDVAQMLQQLHEMGMQNSPDLSRAKLILLKLLASSKSAELNKEHLLLLVTSFVHATDEESKAMALGLLRDMLAVAGLVNDNESHRHDLRVWLHFIQPEECDTLAEIVVSCLMAKAGHPEKPAEKRRQSRRSQAVAAEEIDRILFSPLTISLLEDARIRKEAGYLERTISALLFVQEDVDRFCTYLDGLKLNLKKVDKIVKGVKKGDLQISSSPSKKVKEGKDFFSVFLEIMRLLSMFTTKREASSLANLHVLADLLSTDYLEMKQRLINEVLQSSGAKLLFQPFSSDHNETSHFVCDHLLSMRKAEENDYFKTLFLLQCKKHLDEKVRDLVGSQDVISKAFKQFSYTSEEVNDLVLSIFHQKSSSATAIFILTCVLDVVVRCKIVLSQDSERAFHSNIGKWIQVSLKKTVDTPNISSRLCDTVAKYLPSCGAKLTDIFSPDGMVKYWQHIQATKELVMALVTIDQDYARAFLQLLSDNPDMLKVDSKNVLLVLSSLLAAKHDLAEDELSSLNSVLKTELKKFVDGGECQEDCEDSMCRTIELLCSHYNCNLAGIKPDFEVRSVAQLRGRLAVARAKGSKSVHFASLVLLRGMQFAVQNMKKLVAAAQGVELAAELFVLLGNCLDIGIDANEVQLDGSNQEVWTQFVKTVLKYGLKDRGDVAKLNEVCLKTLRRLFPRVYSDKSSRLEEVRMISSMIFGHSCFMQVMLESTSSSQQHSAVKAELSKLLLTLMRLNPEICEAGNIPIFLAAYHGTLSRSDQAILQILREYERNKVTGLGQYFPIIFGQSAISHYSVRKGGDGASSGTSLWKRPKASEILSLIEPERMTRSAVNFPLEMTLIPSEEDDDREGEGVDDESTYDPRFFLSLATQVCSPGAFVDRHLKLVESGLLALAFGSLSSRDPSMRAAGYVVLSRVFHQLETAKLTAEKKIWLHLIDLVRNGVRMAKGDHRLRIPPVVSVFLVRVSAILHSPLHPMYKAVSSFVLAKPTLELFNVPEFLRLFHSKEANHVEERNWILEILRDGMRDELDYQIMQKDFVFKLVMSFHGSMLATSDATTKVLVRQIVLRAVRLVQPAFDLVKQHGLNLWVIAELASGSAASSGGGDRDAMVQDMLEIVTTALSTVVKSLANGGRLPGSIFHDFQMVLDSFAEDKRRLECWKKGQKMLLGSKPIPFGRDEAETIN